jgi:serine/threonine protein kinase
MTQAVGAAQPGLRLGPWELLRRIGSGGLAEVWEAHRIDGLYEARAAIKLLQGDGTTATVARRFMRERAALGWLTHTGIAALLDAGVQPPHAYLVLEFVDGLPLDQHVRRHCPTVAQRIALVLQIAEAVEYAHGRLVVHRDLKPANILVTAAGLPKLLDFGLAASPGQDAADTHAGLTPGHAAPEQVADDAVSTAVDVFALGVLLFELLSGQLPFGRRGDSRAVLDHAVLHQPPHRLATLLKSTSDDGHGPGAPRDARRALGDLEAIANQALGKLPEQRYAGVHAFIDDLRRWQVQLPVAARRDHGRLRRAALLLRRHALLSALGALVLVSLVGGLAASTWQWQRAETARQRSDAVGRFLADLLSEDGHLRDGRSPNVLELLDDSRAKLDTAFTDDPATRQRLLEVMSRTYMALNRFDHAQPLGEQWLALARQQHGEDERPVLQARLSLGQVHQINGNHDAAIALLEPLAAPLAREFGPDSEEVRQQQFILAADYMHSGRLDDSERALERVRVLTEKLHPNDDYERADYLLNLDVLRRLQGRVAEALQVARQTKPLWNSTDPRLTMPVLVLRRHELSLMGMNAEFEGIDARGGPLLADIRRALGPGNDFALQVASNWASVQLWEGRHADELRTREKLLDGARADGLAPAQLLTFRAELLVAQARSGRPDLPAMRALLAEAAALDGGGRRSRSLLLLAEAALAAGEPTLATDALRRLRERPLPGALALRGSRLDQIEGRLARARGDLQRSAELLARVNDIGAIQRWAARIDRALTAQLQRAPDAAQQLEAARQARPVVLRPGHPLDLVSQWLRARQAAGRDDDAGVQAAWKRLASARGPGAAPPTLGSLGGLLP